MVETSTNGVHDPANFVTIIELGTVTLQDGKPFLLLKDFFALRHEDINDLLTCLGDNLTGSVRPRLIIRAWSLKSLKCCIRSKKKRDDILRSRPCVYTFQRLLTCFTWKRSELCSDPAFSKETYECSPCPSLEDIIPHIFSRGEFEDAWCSTSALFAF